MKTRIQQTILAAACLMLVNMLNAQVVTSGADDGTDGTLRVEIADTPNGGEVTFATGVSEVLLTDEIIIDKNITITGNSGDLNIIINAQNTSRHFYVTNSASFVLNNLGLINGQAEDGGAVYLDAADLVATNCQFDSNIADGSSGSGGAVFVDTGGYLEADLCSFTFNRANRAGGAIEDNSGVGLGIVINTSELMNNNTGVAPATAAPGNGGALHITGPGDSEIDNCTIRDNEAAREGGGLWNGSGLMTITDASMIDNIAYGDDAIHGGGALFNNGGVMIVNTSNLSGNSATGVSGSGGGILNLGGDLTVNGGGIISNTANRAGGGIEATDGSMTTLMNVALDNNIAGPDGFAAPGNGGGFHITAGGNAMITDGSVNGNFAGAEGGGLWNGSGTMTVNGTDIMDNVAVGNDADHGGAGLFNVAGILNATGVTVTGNTSTGTAGSGGGILNQGTLTVTDSEISGNTANRAGGGIEATDGSMTTLTNVILDNNIAGPDGSAAPGNGGGFHITASGGAIITDCSVSGNFAAREGGGLWNGSGTMNVTGGAIMANEAIGMDANHGGGGLFNNGGTMELNSVMIADNIASGASGSGGGLLSTDGDVTIDDCQFLANYAARAGGAIEIIDGDLTLSGSDLVSNDVNGLEVAAAPGNGGAIHITGMSGIIDISSSIFFANEAANEGGAIWNQAGTSMTISTCTIDLNFAADGGGVFNNGGITNIMSTSFAENYAFQTGGAIYNETGTMNLMTSTISGNFSDGNGGGITNLDFMTIDAVTVAENFAAADGGGIFSSASTTIKNSIVASNNASAGADVSGAFVSEGYNLIASDDGSFAAVATDLINVDPMLDILQDNGGPTFTHNLMAGSPAVDGGAPGDMFNDQRGNPVIGIRDIGAVEFGGAAVMVEAGIISTDDMTEICAGDGLADPINVTLSGGQGPDMTYIITDAGGEILALAEGPVFDLEGAGAGNCSIYHLYYDMNEISGLDVGGNISSLSDEEGLSNSIVVVRNGGGCTDPSSVNFDPDACFDDGSCVDEECVTETFDSQISGWQMTELVWSPGDEVAIQPLNTNYAVVPVSGEEAGQTVQGVYIQGRFFIGIDSDFHADFAGPGYADNTNWSDWGDYLSALPSSNTTAMFNLSGTGDEEVLAFRWIGFLDANDNGTFDSGVDRYLGQIDQDGMMLPEDASGRLYIGFSDRLGQFADNLGELSLTYCYGEEFVNIAQTYEQAKARTSQGDDSITDAELAKLIAASGVDLSVFPNPTNGLFTLSSSAEITQYEITDMTGRVIMSTIMSPTTISEVDLGGEARGTYLINVTMADGQTSTSRIVLSR